MCLNDSLTSAFWPAIRDTLRKDPSNFQNLDLRCFFCLCKMVPAGGEIKAEEGEEEVCHGISILPCGHLAGTKCLQEWMTKGGGFHCALCRRDFWHSDPDCFHPLVTYPLTTISDIYSAPLCLQEGSQVPKKCLKCLFAADIWTVSSYINNTILRQCFPDPKFRHSILSIRICPDWGVLDEETSLAIGTTSVAPKHVINYSLEKVLPEPFQLIDDRLAKVWAPKIAELSLGVCIEGSYGKAMSWLIQKTLNTATAQSWIRRFRMLAP